MSITWMSVIAAAVGAVPRIRSSFLARVTGFAYRCNSGGSRRSRVHPELLKDVLEMLADRAGRDPEQRRDLGIRPALGVELENFPLARCELLGRTREWQRRTPPRGRLPADDPETKTFPSTVYSNLSPTPLPYGWDVQGEDVTITVAYGPLDATFTGSWREDGTFSGGWRPNPGADETVNVPTTSVAAASIMAFTLGGKCSECVRDRLPLPEALRDELSPLLLAPAVQHLEI
jgi:hypothetical protein